MRDLSGMIGCVRAVWRVVFTLFAIGCGGSTNLDGSIANGGGGAAGRDSGAPQAGSSPAQGASHLVLVFSSTTSCPISGANAWSIPTGSLTNSTTVGSQVVDGMNGATVSCTVRTSGGGFSVSGALTSADQISFSVQGTLAPGSGGNAYQGTGTISHYSTTSLTLQGSGCTITANQTQGAQIGPGRIWVDFDCPTFNPVSAATGGCAAQGTFVFGNCAQ